MILNKDSPIPNKWWTAVLVGVLGGGIIAVHWRYLWRIVEHTIGDAGIMRWAEREMWMLALETCKTPSQTGIAEQLTAIPVFVPQVKDTVCEGDRKFKMYPNLSRYGTAQIAMTFILVGAAIIAIVSRPVTR